MPSLGHHRDRPGLQQPQERIKRKISSREFTAPSTHGTRPLNGVSRQISSSMYSQDSPQHQADSVRRQDQQQQKQQLHHGYAQNQPLDSFDFQQGTQQRLSERYARTYEIKQDMIADEGSKRDPQTERKDYRTNDRLTPTSERPVNGYREQDEDHPRAESVFSKWTPALYGRDTHGRDHDRHPPAQVDSKKGGFLTIRDILDNRDIRNQISELRRSQNEQDRASTVQSRGPHESEYTPSSAAITTHHSNHKLNQKREEPAAMMDGTARITRKDSGASDLYTDRSPMERNFRGESQASGFATIDPSRRSPLIRQYTATSNNSNIGPGDYRHALPSERQRRELYHSSYSPSDFSHGEGQDDDDEKQDEDEDEGEHEQDTVELTRTIRPGKPNVPVAPVPAPITPPSLSPRQSSAPSTTGQDTHLNPQTAQSSKIKDDRQRRNDNPGYGGGDISFEREVAIARAKRELGASADKRTITAIGATAGPSTAQTASIPSGSVAPSVATTSRLDHGRDLALEDLEPPTKYNFGARPAQQGHSQQQQKQRQAMARQQLLSTAADLAQLDIVTGQEDRFLELAGSLGEGQAVSSVLGTLKAMIRQLKSEKKASIRDNKKLQKDLQKKERELERTRKANEKLSTRQKESRLGKERVSSSSPSSHMVGRHIPLEEREQESRKDGVQREKDRAERNLHALQGRIDALEAQRIAMQRQERKRAEEEADLLFLLDSGDGDDDGEDDDENSDSESESESESEESDPEERDQTALRTNRHDAISGSTRDMASSSRGQRSLSAKRRAAGKTSSNSPSRARSGRKNRTQPNDRTEPLNSLGQELRSKTERKVMRSKSASPETRRIVEKVEEVHIHHHVHYGGEKDTSSPSSSRSRPLLDTERRALHRDDAEFGIPEDAHRLSAGSAFRSQRGRSVTQELLDIPPSASRNPLSRSLPGQRSHAAERHAEGALVEPQQQLHQKMSQPRRQHTDPSIRAVSGLETVPQNEQRPGILLSQALALDDDAEGYQPFRIRSIGAPKSRIQELTAALTNPALKQKTFSIDLQRILSLLKTHDPRRCTVCCNGGTSDSQDHDNLHHHHHHQQHSQERDGRQQTSLKISGKPVVIRQRRTEDVGLHRSSTGTAAPTTSSQRKVVDSDSDSAEFPLTPAMGNNVAGPSEREHRVSHHRDKASSQRKQQQQQRKLPGEKGKEPLRQEIAKDDNDAKDENKDEDQTPEQKLQVVLTELEKEVQQLRRSYFELSKDLETLGCSSSGAGDTEEGNSSTGGTKATKTAKSEKRPEILKEQLRQKTMIREQLQQVADSLAEKADVILRLQERYMQQREQHIREGEKGKKTSHSGEARRSSSKVRHDNKAESTTIKGKMSTRTTSFMDSAGGTRHRGDGIDNGDEEKKRQQREKDEEDTDGRDDTQDTARPQKEQRRRANDNNDDNDHDNAELGDEQREKKLKEPEGYRHRHANGFRVPKIR
ncbi:hypothetical protein EDD21DRAFT_387029 [Dissophora ornata]|nr:hypothetical protein EDD21DRAFT_387029 [Dissophora ornata]